MATDPLAKVRNEIGLRVAEIREAGPRLSPLDLYARMDAIRHLAALNGLATLEGLARCSAQLALLPGHRVAVQTCSRQGAVSRACALSDVPLMYSTPQRKYHGPVLYPT